jgi:hypothetical protein
MWMPFLIGACCGSALTTMFFYLTVGSDIRREEALRWESAPLAPEREEA